jgi:hypothetical protein
MPDESNNASPSLLRGYGWELLHHALLAATIAAILLALGTRPGFRLYDLALRAFVAQLQSLKDEDARRTLFTRGFVPTFSPHAAGDRPLVLLLRNPGEQSEYRQQSLTRFYADLIVELTYANPAVLAIDVALGPVIDDRVLVEGARVVPPKESFQEFMRKLPGEPPAREYPPAPSAEEIALEDRKRLQDAIRNAAKSFPVVLTAPPFRWRDANDFRRWAALARPPELRLFMRDLDWLAEVCRMPNVWVAMPIPLPEMVHTYSPSQETLGTVAAHVVAPGAEPPRRTRICSTLDEFLSTPGSSRNYGLLVERIGELEMPAMNEQPAILNPQFYETTSYWTPLDAHNARRTDALAVIMPPGLKAKAVFVGAETTRHRALGSQKVSPVDIEAAIFYSNRNPVREVPHTLVFAAEVAFGTLLGVLFTFGWGRYVKAADRMDQLPLRPLREKAGAWAWARLVLLPVNLALLIACLVFAWWLTDYALRGNTWINPVPLVIGMSLKGLLGSRQRHVGHRPQSFSELVKHHPDVLWQLAIVPVCLAVAAFAH